MTVTIGNVIIPVADQDVALSFYTDIVGFEKRADLAFGGELRWLEVGPSGSGTTIAICPPGPGVTPGGKETGISLHVEDAASFHAHLRDAGVDVDAEVGHFEGAPPTFWFRDPEGNTLMVAQAL
ncbi:MAG: VOC family protein [Streptomyces sp.]|jgi:catechol 2,3-dioxygenase-like lactoylglutathione lyase family enzyme|nr:VOC family protein [Streptomyces sp.]